MIIRDATTFNYERDIAWQIPEHEIRYDHSRTTVRVHRDDVDGTLSVWHGPRLLERFDAGGQAS